MKYSFIFFCCQVFRYQNSFQICIFIVFNMLESFIFSVSIVTCFPNGLKLQFLSCPLETGSKNQIDMYVQIVQILPTLFAYIYCYESKLEYLKQLLLLSNPHLFFPHTTCTTYLSIVADHVHPFHINGIPCGLFQLDNGPWLILGMPA